MNIFSGVEKHPEQLFDQRLSLSLRLPILLHLLLGRTPIRRLAQSLILVLLLISPLSFSTDKIPNFVYECQVSAGGSEKLKRSLAVQRTVALGPVHPSLLQLQCRPFLVSLTPTVQLVSNSFPCRAPPV